MNKNWDNWEAPEPGNFVCSICLEPLSAEAGIECTDAALERYSDKSAVVTLICGHVFHMFCLQQNYWARREYGERRCCPICKRKLITEPLSSPMIRLYPTTDDYTKPPPCNRCKVLEAELEKLRLMKENQRRQPPLQGEWTHGRGHAVRGGPGDRGRGHVIRGGARAEGPCRGHAVGGSGGGRGHVIRGGAGGRARSRGYGYGVGVSRLPRPSELVFKSWRSGGTEGYYYSVDEEW